MQRPTLAYERSRYSTMSGRKLALGSGSRAITAVHMTRLPPRDATTAPSVRRARRPVSNPMLAACFAWPSSTCVGVGAGAAGVGNVGSVGRCGRVWGSGSEGVC